MAKRNLTEPYITLNRVNAETAIGEIAVSLQYERQQVRNVEVLLPRATSAAAILRDSTDGGRWQSVAVGGGGFWPFGCTSAVAIRFVAVSTRLDAAVTGGNEESDGADLYTAGQTGHVWLQSLAWGVVGLLRCYQSDAGTDEYGGR